MQYKVQRCRCSGCGGAGIQGADVHDTRCRCVQMCTAHSQSCPHPSLPPSSPCCHMNPTLSSGTCSFSKSPALSPVPARLQRQSLPSLPMPVTLAVLALSLFRLQSPAGGRSPSLPQHLRPSPSHPDPLGFGLSFCFWVRSVTQIGHNPGCLMSSLGALSASFYRPRDAELLRHRWGVLITIVIRTMITVIITMGIRTMITVVMTILITTTSAPCQHAPVPGGRSPRCSRRCPRGRGCRARSERSPTSAGDQPRSSPQPRGGFGEVLSTPGTPQLPSAVPQAGQGWGHAGVGSRDTSRSCPRGPSAGSALRGSEPPGSPPGWALSPRPGSPHTRRCSRSRGHQTFMAFGCAAQPEPHGLCIFHFFAIKNV